MDLAETTTVLQVDKLSCIRNDIELFCDLNFKLQSGQVLQIEGANGCGKTSLLRILCGLMLPADGEVKWNGVNIQHDRIEYNNNIAYIGHHNGIKADLSCEENLQFFHDLGNTKENIDIDDILDKIGLQEKDESLAGKLSAGQRRRLALARLLMTNAPLWILDEPFTALDPKGRELIEGYFDQHCSQGGMIIFTTHHAVALEHSQIQFLRIGHE
ncbi:MAG: cytochrome c biogenesis heme-transporting ATPase CcmA [Gammaproteobacteria bacterium]|nr:cytochrome c biogenesis heme-transporting ATPase CcmA [Gammaproteobacteria bacterium]